MSDLEDTTEKPDLEARKKYKNTEREDGQRGEEQQAHFLRKKLTNRKKTETKDTVVQFSQF